MSSLNSTSVNNKYEKNLSCYKNELQEQFTKKNLELRHIIEHRNGMYHKKDVPAHIAIAFPHSHKDKKSKQSASARV